MTLRTARPPIDADESVDSGMKNVLITGVTGQDGSFLAELLLGKGYRVFGLARRESWYRPNNASHLTDQVKVIVGDMSEGVDIAAAVRTRGRMKSITWQNVTHDTNPEGQQ